MSLYRKSALTTFGICAVFWIAAGEACAPAAQPLGLPWRTKAPTFVRHTFSSDANFTPATVDMGLTDARGYQWYLWNFFGSAQPSSRARLARDGTITLAGGAANGLIASAAQIHHRPGFVGSAFGGGGYFEAELAFDPASVDRTKGWPAWWAMALEHLANLPGQGWPGQSSDFEHFIEADIFEADVDQSNAYGGTAHDWSGAWTPARPYVDIHPPYRAGVRAVPSGTDFKRFHRYGLLWIPATETAPGSLTYYFDGRQIGPATTYTPSKTQQPPPRSPWTYGVIDRQHLVLILGSGADSSMRVRAVDVWQASAAQNLTN